MKCVIIFCLLLAWPTQLGYADDTFLGRSADQWSDALTASKGQERIHAAWAIAQLASRSADGPNGHVYFAELVKLISDSDPTVRYWGVQGLGWYGERVGKQGGGQSVVANTLRPLLTDKSPAPRIAAAEQLGVLGHADQALPTLVNAMSDPQESVRIQAAAAFEKLGPSARPALETIRRGTSDSSEYVKRITERALARLESTK